MKIDTSTSFIDEFIDEELDRDPTFRTAYQAELAAESQDRQAREALMAQFVKIRKAKKIRQDVIAKRIGVSQARISQIEHLRGGVTFDAVMGYARCIGAEIVVLPRKEIGAGN